MRFSESEEGATAPSLHMETEAAFCEIIPAGRLAF